MPLGTAHIYIAYNRILLPDSTSYFVPIELQIVFAQVTFHGIFHVASVLLITHLDQKQRSLTIAFSKES